MRSWPGNKAGDILTLTAKAEEFDEEAFAAAKKRAEPSYLKGAAALKEGNKDDARQFFSDALEILPNYSKVLFALGMPVIS